MKYDTQAESYRDTLGEAAPHMIALALQDSGEVHEEDLMGLAVTRATKQ